MEKEGYGAARRDVFICFCGLIENGQDGVYGFGKSFERVRGAEKDIGAGVIKIEGREAKLWSWEPWFWMGTTIQFGVADPVVRVLDR